RLSLASTAPIPCCQERARRSRDSISVDRRPATAAALTGRLATSRRTRLLTTFSSSVPGRAWPPRNGGIDPNVGGIALRAMRLRITWTGLRTCALVRRNPLDYGGLRPSLLKYLDPNRFWIEPLGAS